MVLLFALAENLSSPLLNRGSVFRVLIPDIRLFYQAKSQGIDYLYIFAILSLNFILLLHLVCWL